jgi:PAS domain S-box-containing protein
MPCHLITRLKPSPSGEPRYRTAILDLTDQRRVEEALATTERRLSAAVEASGAGIFEIALPFKGLLYLSHRVAEILGYSRMELAEPPEIPAWVEAHLHPEDAGLLRAMWTEVRENRRSSFHGDVRFRHRDGDWRWLRVWARVSSAPNASSLDVVGAVMDVTLDKARTLKIERQVAQLRGLTAELHDVGSARDGSSRRSSTTTSPSSSSRRR